MPNWQRIKNMSGHPGSIRSSLSRLPDWVPIGRANLLQSGFPDCCTIRTTGLQSGFWLRLPIGKKNPNQDLSTLKQDFTFGFGIVLVFDRVVFEGCPDCPDAPIGYSAVFATLPIEDFNPRLLPTRLAGPIPIASCLDCVLIGSPRLPPDWTGVSSMFSQSSMKELL